MEILLTAEGFVTNSSSANYWLDDGILEKGELEEFVKNIDKKNANLLKLKKEQFAVAKIKQQTVQEDKILKETVVDLTIWLFFSLILVIIFFLRKFQKK